MGFATEETVVFADAFVFRQMNATGLAADHVFQRLSLIRPAFAFVFDEQRVNQPDRDNNQDKFNHCR